MGYMKDFLRFILEKKKYWLLPFLVMGLLFFLLALSIELLPASPFIYTLF